MFEEVKKKKLQQIEENYNNHKKTVDYLIELIQKDSLDKLFKNNNESQIYEIVDATFRELYKNYPLCLSKSNKTLEYSEKFGWEETVPGQKLTNKGKDILNNYRAILGKPSLEEYKKQIEKRFRSLSDDI
jgi:hypothetical protein